MLNQYCLVNFIIAIILSSCSTPEKKVNAVYLQFLNDLEKEEKTSFILDSTSYTAFHEDSNSYYLAYHNVGAINNQTGLTAYHINKDSIQVNLLNKGKEKWEIMDSVIIEERHFSPAMFSPLYKDYNNDGIKDVYLVFHQTMGVCYSTGFIVLIDNKLNTLKLIRNSNQEYDLDVENCKILSRTWNHPAHEFDKYEIYREFEIVNDSLKLVKSTKEYLKGSGPRIFERIQDYFDSNVIKPTIDTLGKYSFGEVESLNINNHLIEWQTDSIDNSLQIWINKKPLNLSKSITLNKIKDGSPDSLNFPNQITDLKYYKIGNKEYFGFALKFMNCTGLGCSVSHFSLYDIQNKTASFFGSFRGTQGWEFKLYNFKNSPNLNYIAQDYYGDNHQGLDSLKWSLFELDQNGKMIKDTNNFIKHFYHKDELFEGYQEINWFEDI